MRIMTLLFLCFNIAFSNVLIMSKSSDYDTIIKLGCDYYGLNYSFSTDILHDATSIIIDAVYFKKYYHILKEQNINILVYNVDNSIEDLGIIVSNGNVIGGRFHDVDELSNIEIPVSFIDNEAYHFSEKFEPIITFDDKQYLLSKYENIFILSNSVDFNAWQYDYRTFHDIAPVLIFLKHVYKKQCLHRIKDFANLTIDDPILREPYGFLSYFGLLEQMEKVKFHTTIAFIPINYNKNTTRAKNIFMLNLEYFSLAVHGNDHDRNEFRDNSKTKYEYKINQSIKRMDMMSLNNTGLEFSRVMIYPQHIGPDFTFEYLRQNNYIATINAIMLPLQCDDNIRCIEKLRNVYSRTANFPSLRRYAPFKELNTKERYTIAIDLFLNNSVLRYTHHAFFKESITNFNQTAKFINHIQPNVEWTNLENIVKHLYLIRENEQFDEIFMETRMASIYNRSNVDREFRIHRREINDVESVCFNGIPVEYDQMNDSISINIVLSPNGSGLIEVKYAEIDIAIIDKSTVEIKILRFLAEFRDLYLSKTQFIVDMYYSHNVILIIVVVLSAIFLVIVLSLMFLTQKRLKKYDFPDDDTFN